MSTPLSLQDFAPHINTRFQVAQFENYFLTLTQVSDRSNAHSESFILTFVGVASPWMRQGTYTLLHPALGEQELFLVPNGPDADGMLYSATFSRIIPAKAP
jgi:hypothetical protein